MTEIQWTVQWRYTNRLHQLHQLQLVNKFIIAAALTFDSILDGPKLIRKIEM